MIIEKTFIKDLVIIKPSVFKDSRGYFFESYSKKKLHNMLDVTFVQDNESMSHKGVLRGLHFQKPPYTQGKLVRAITGSILDVVVDLRKKSTTYGKHFGHVLSAANKNQLYVPKGFAHGFLVLEDNSIFSYKCSEYYHKEAECSLLWNDKTLAIDWQIENPIISDKDKNGKKFDNFKSPF